MKQVLKFLLIPIIGLVIVSCSKQGGVMIFLTHSKWSLNHIHSLFKKLKRLYIMNYKKLNQL